ncbi:MFS transporter [Candidatus Nomurabacteria bacterium]|nr:MFS transporter [Candidatus Nomurabacteria bacterium]
MNKQYLTRVYILGFLFSFHLALTAYVNSTFLSTLISEKYIGLMYATSSLVTLITLSLLSPILARIGNKKTTMIFLIGNVASIAAFIFAHNLWILIAAFATFLITNTLVFYCFDIFIEHWSVRGTIGKARGLYLTTINLAWVISPFLSGVIVQTYGYKGMYLLAGILGFSVLCLLPFFVKHFTDPQYVKISLLKAYTRLKQHPQITRIVFLNFLLQFFFALMIVYMPIYLHEHMYFDWTHIGIIFTIMLSPFVFLGFPLGKIADKIGGEKGFLIAGFLITAITTYLTGISSSSSIIVWAVLLFLTRVGAATIETMSEIYFFKHVSEKDTDLLSVFRDMTPVAFLTAPLIGSAVVATSSYTVLFIGLSILMVIGAYASYTLKQ